MINYVDVECFFVEEKKDLIVIKYLGDKQYLPKAYIGNPEALDGLEEGDSCKLLVADFFYEENLEDDMDED